MGMTIDEVIKELEWALANNTIEDVESAFKYILAIHMAIDTMRKYQMMQADYEARLKADVVAMLTEIQLELDEMKITKVRSAGFAPYSKDPFRRGVNCSKEIIQQKINSIKAEKEKGK